MLISSASLNYNNTAKSSFGSNKRAVYQDGELLYKNTTRFFRDDLNWDALVKFLDEKYKDCKNVNIFNFACSDGSEPWSLAVILMEKLKALAAKFFPIRASDIDEVMINSIKMQPCNVSDMDLRRVNKFVNGKYFDYFKMVKSWSSKYLMGFLPHEKLNKNVEFKQADIFDEIEEIKPENNIILARNFWSYLKPEEIKKLLIIFAEKLDPTSCLIIGELEKGHHYDKLLKEHDFYETGVYNVFVKKS